MKKRLIVWICYFVIYCVTASYRRRLQIFPTGSVQATVYPSVISAPDKPTKALIGDTVSFRWHYNLGDLKNDLFEVFFGIWESPEFLKTKLIAVNSSGFSSTKPSHESSVGWAGNLSSPIAVFELYKVQLEDDKLYGIVVEYGLRNAPLTDTVQLQVESRLQVGSRRPPVTATPQQKNVLTAVGATIIFEPVSPLTSKEPNISLPRKPSVAVARGAMLYAKITFIVVIHWFASLIIFGWVV